MAGSSRIKGAGLRSGPRSFSGLAVVAMKVVHPGKSGQAGGCETVSAERQITRMNLHKNARLMPQGRHLLVQRITEQGWTVSAAGRARGRDRALAAPAPERPGERIAAIGHRITGAALRAAHRGRPWEPAARRDTRRGAGWEAVHVCIDDASRLAYSEVLPDERKTSTMPSWSARSPGSHARA